MALLFKNGFKSPLTKMYYQLKMGLKSPLTKMYYQLKMGLKTSSKADLNFLFQ